MQNIYRPIVGVIISLVIVISIGLKTLRAYADTVGPHQPPPSIPKHGLCSIYSIPTYSFYLLSSPEGISQAGPAAGGPLSPSVTASGGVDVWNNTSCSNGEVKFSLQTKVCGFWGCHWRETTGSNWSVLPTSGEINATLNSTCRNGTNSYRIIGLISYVQLDFEDTPNGNWIPYLETKNDEHDGPEVKISC